MTYWPTHRRRNQERRRRRAYVIRQAQAEQRTPRQARQ